MAQTSVSNSITGAYVGGLADVCDYTARAYRNNAGSAIAYGLAVAHDTGTGTSALALKVPDADDVIVGVLIHSMFETPQADGLADDAIGNVLSKGRVWVTAENAVTPSSAVTVRYAGGGTAGGFRGGSVVADETRTLSGARFLTSAGAGELVLLEINLP